MASEEEALIEFDEDQCAVPWQLRTTSVLERDEYILFHLLWTDCTVTVGSGSKKEVFKCHRIYLAKSSSVLAVMLYEKKKKSHCNITLPDLAPAAFKQVLSTLTMLHLQSITLAISNTLSKVTEFTICQLFTHPVYIYTDSIKQQGWEEMYEVASAARHLKLPHLLNACLNHLRSQANVGNACTLYELSQKTNNTSLAQHCFKIMCDNAARILEEPGIEQISLTSLTSLLSQDTLHVASDIPLIEASVRWARCEVQRKGLTETPVAMREALGPAFSLLRFLSLTPAQFAAYPSKSDLLTLEECLSILSNLSSPGVAELPPYFCKTMETRGGYLFGHGRVFLCQPAMEKYFFNKGQPKWCEFAFEFEVNYDLILLGAQIPSQVLVPKIGAQNEVKDDPDENKFDNSSNGDDVDSDDSQDSQILDGYQEDLDITFEKPKPRSRAAMHFVSSVPYNSMISMKFDKPFLILKGEKYKMYVHLRRKGWYQTGFTSGNMKPLGAELNFTVTKENFFHSLIFTR